MSRHCSVINTSQQWRAREFSIGGGGFGDVISYNTFK